MTLNLEAIVAHHAASGFAFAAYVIVFACKSDPGSNALDAAAAPSETTVPDVFSPHFRGTEMRAGIVREGTTLSTRDNYRQNAIECLRLARSAPTASDRTALVDMAHTWRRLAEHASAISCFAELVAVEGGIKP